MKTATNAMLWLLAAVILFHLSIVLKIVPYDITWGGRLTNDNEMYVFEAISILVNLFLVLLLLIKAEYLKDFIPLKVVDIVLWIFVVLFGLNTIGNILAKTTFEKYFALLTLVSSLLILITLVKGKKVIKDSFQDHS